MKFTVDPWDPEYGASLEGDLDPTEADVNVEVEVRAGEWRPLDPPADVEPPGVVVFVDGVRRVEARVWIERAGVDGVVDPGLCASYAAGAVRCDGLAALDHAIVGRGLFCASPDAEAITTRHGTFAPVMAGADSPDALSLALQEQMGRAEIEAAEAAIDGEVDSLIVVDGPLRGRVHLPHAIGFVKTHHVAYLPDDIQPVVGRLAAGQRTPVFTLGTSWSRHTWYLRLPGAQDSPWAGVVRCECRPDVSPAEATALADTAAATLPRYASSPHKDPRAPQNLYPIGGLERAIRRRMGDPHLLYRALRRAAV